MSGAATTAAGSEHAPVGGAPAVVLASASSTRAMLLRNAGVPCLADAAAIDEEEAKGALKATGAETGSAAEALAELKAQKVSRRHGGALVVGADQILECAGTWFDKPAGLDEARAHLKALRGREHELVSALAVVRDGARLWHHVDRARLKMRAFSDAFIESYLAALGPRACGSVGAYQLEGLGAQLFERVEGDYFTILGLPLLPLLAFLRNHGVVPA
ncbi:MAG TPA: Maf family protein [Alphaproteobacteria bacterium]|nr:Maf family protein [Alphaproteobacteria bacterium]